MSYRETEIKLQVQDTEPILKKLIALGAVLKTARHFEDNYLFDTSDSSLRKSGMLLRLRFVDGRGIMTFKSKGRISDGVKDREEIECSVDPPEKLERILEQLGYSVSFRYQKYRSVYEIEGRPVEIFLDETPIGKYLEIEGEIDTIHQVASSLGFARDAYITESYAALYHAWCQAHGKTPSHMTF